MVLPLKRGGSESGLESTMTDMRVAKMTETSNDGLDEAIFKAAEGILDNYEYVGVAVMETPEEDDETVIYATNSRNSTPEGFIRLPGVDAETLYAMHTVCGLRVFNTEQGYLLG